MLSIKRSGVAHAHTASASSTAHPSMESQFQRIVSLALILAGLIAAMWHARLLYFATNTSQLNHRADELRRRESAFHIEPSAIETNESTHPLESQPTTPALYSSIAAFANSDTESTTSSSTHDNAMLHTVSPTNTETLLLVSPTNEGALTTPTTLSPTASYANSDAESATSSSTYDNHLPHTNSPATTEALPMVSSSDEEPFFTNSASHTTPDGNDTSANPQ